MTKRFAARFVGFSILVSLFSFFASGCSGDSARLDTPDIDYDPGQPWTLESAAVPYAGTTITTAFLDRPGYTAAISLIPEFEERTGIDVVWDVVPYENSREFQVLDFISGNPAIDVVLVDLIWLGEFSESGWLTPLDTFIENPRLTDPTLDLNDFFPILLDGFGTWDDVLYGLPFDNYSGLLFYNRCHLEEAGFSEPPATWEDLRDVYLPKLNDPENGRFGYALQARRGETQSCDAFMRFLWPFGGSLLDETFRGNLLSLESQAGLTYRQSLSPLMPPGIVDYDHIEAVNALAQGKVSMITEWSSFYTTLADPQSSTITECLAVAPEPSGPARRVPALGGFSLGVNAASSTAEQEAAWLFVQWITSSEMARKYIEAGGVSARQSAYEDLAIRDAYPFVDPMVASWQDGIPYFRPRFPDWPEISEHMAEVGSRLMLGELSTEEAGRELNQRVEAILERSGYYNGSRSLLQ